MALISFGVSFLPVLLFLVALTLIDNYQLVERRTLLLTIAIGCWVAVIAWFVNTALVDGVGLSQPVLARYVAPLVEELLKGAVLALLLWKNRIGFLVDAAILGFAIGAGFATVENLYFLGSRDLALGTWIVRGFGTAIMHGGATAVFAILAKRALDRSGDFSWMALGLPLAAAAVMHSAYNHFFLPPLLSAAAVSLAFPLLVAVVFSRSEAATRTWISDGFDTDQEVLRLMQTGELSETRVGHYLAELKARFPGEVLVDMLCLLRLEAELSIRAKGILMMREAGFDPKPDEALTAKVDETRYLEDSIGAIGRMALDPFLRIRGREQWQRQVLGIR